MADVDQSPTGMAEIGIVRRSLKDLLRSYSVFIDDQVVGSLMAFQTKRYSVSPGRHEVNVRVGRRTMAGPPQADIEVKAGQTRDLRVVGPGLTFDWRNFPFFVAWKRGSWINLKPTPDHSNEAEPPSGTRGTLPAVKSLDALIRDVSFARALMGYDRNQVDALLAQLQSKVRLGDRLSSTEISDVTFRLVRGGYDVNEVDRLLANVARSVEN